MGRFLFSGFRARSRGRRNAELPRGFDARGSRMAGLPPDLFGWARTVPWREIPTSVVRSRYGGCRVIFCEKMLLEGAGGPVSLRTSSPVRSLSRVDTDPHAALAGLTCRASPANSSVAGGASLDSVRLRRNCSLLLCVSQSSSLTCARGADRACAREKAGLRVEILTALVPARKPGCGWNTGRACARKTTVLDRVWAWS